MISANQKLKQLDHEMVNKADTTKEMLVALEHLSDKELSLLGVNSRITQMRSVHRVLKREALIKDIRTLAQELSKQCRNYRARFDKCVKLGLPSPFTGSGDIYDEDVYLGRIRIIMKDDTIFDKV